MLPLQSSCRLRPATASHALSPGAPLPCATACRALSLEELRCSPVSPASVRASVLLPLGLCDDERRRALDLFEARVPSRAQPQRTW